MAPINKVAVFGASGNFGTPITTALTSAGFAVTVITRIDSTSTFPSGLPVIRTAYTTPDLTAALAGQDAAVCVVGPAGVHLQSAMIDAAAAAGVKRFVIDDFGWGLEGNGLKEFTEVHKLRTAQWDHARATAEGNKSFTWTGISSGNPIDWAMRRFPLMGFNAATSSAIIYNEGADTFTGTTLEGIGQSVVGVLQHPEETANRFVTVMSIDTCQNDLLAAYQTITGKEWAVERSTTAALLKDGREKMKEGKGGWILSLAVGALYDPELRGRVAGSREESDSDLLGIKKETAEDVAKKVLG